MSYRTILTAVLAFVLCSNLVAQANTQHFESSFTGGANAANIDGSPWADGSNPAASAGLQRATLDLSYHLLGGTAAEQGTGHWINLGTSLPSNLGVLSLNGTFASSPLPSQAFGTFMDLRGSFAKDLYNDLYFGLGLGTQFGAPSPGAFDWGLGIDLGFIHLPGTLAFMKDFSWGVAFRGLGKPYTTSMGSVPSYFTPAIAANFALIGSKAVKTDNVVLSLASDLSFPTFQNIVWKNTLALELFKQFGFQLGVDLDTKALAQGYARPLPLHFGISARLGGSTDTLDADGKELPFYRTSEYRPSITIAPLAKGVLDVGFGLAMPLGVSDTKKPQATFSVPEQSNISPDFNGIQDNLEFPLKITDERYIENFTFTVRNKEDLVVRTIRNKELRPETDSFDSLWERFVRVKSGVPIPEKMVWDGTDDLGNRLADGDYTWRIEASDDNGNTYVSKDYAVNIDTKAPELGLSVPTDNPNKAFAPNGDRPSFKFAMNSSPEETWTTEVLDSKGQVIRTLAFKENLPPDSAWDGKTDKGAIASDGVYTIKLTSTDKAGNTSTSVIDNVLLISEPTPVALRPDFNHFSPNKDGVQDSITVTVSSNPLVRVESYVVELLDSKGTVVRSKAGTEILPKQISLARGQVDTNPDTLVFNLENADKSGILPEDSYTLSVSALYINGNRPRAETPGLILDLSPPLATVTLDDSIFSPNADGRKDTLSLTQKTSLEREWTGEITKPDGSKVRTWTWNGQADEKLLWDGLGDDGTELPDGIYRYQALALDQAGNRGASELRSFELDKRKTSVEATILHGAFSPNGDKTKDSQTIRLRWSPAGTIESWKISVVPSANAEQAAPIHVAQGKGAPPADWEWAALQAPGKSYPDGTYRAVVEMNWTKGDLARIFTQDFDIDTQAPMVEVKASADGLAFSPNGDNQKDNITIIQEKSSSELGWTGTLRKKDGSVVQTLSWTGEAQTFVWNGLDQNGKRVPDGEYRYELSSTDPAGNSTRKELQNIVVNTEDIRLGLETSLLAFSPNNDKVKDSIGFTALFSNNANADIKPTSLSSWKLELRSLLANKSEGPILQTLNGTGAPPQKIDWNGKIAGDRTAPEGEYRAVLTVLNNAGTSASVNSAPFTLDITAPKASAYPSFTTFSPDGDGRNDKITMIQESKDLALWEAGIFVRGNNTPVRTWTWNGKLPPTVEWDGLDPASKRALADGTYTYNLRGTDEAGNSADTAPKDLVLDNRNPSIGIKAGSLAFSPNGDTILDRLVFQPTVSLREGIESWTLDIASDAATGSRTVRSLGQKGNPPASIEWDGKTDAGTNAPDASYRATFSITYLKGNKPATLSEAFALDTKAPQITLKPLTLLFSPEGDGFRDLAIIDQTSSLEDLWTGEIVDRSGATVRTYTWKGSTSALNWDGKNQSGKDLPDGSYTYRIKATDLAGNSTSQNLPGLVVDRRDTAIRLATLSSGFAPGSASFGTMSFQPFVDVRDGLESWQLSILNESGKVVSTQAAKGDIPQRLVWDGRSPEGLALDGRYEARLDAVYTKGNRPSSGSGPFVLDTKGPSGSISVNPNPFSPDEDGVEDEVTLGLAIKDLSDIRDWKLEIWDPENNLFTDFAGKGAPAPRIVWNGKSRNGQIVEAAMDYEARLTISDTLGNSSVITNIVPVDVLVFRATDPDTGKEILRIRLPGITFKSSDADLNNKDLKPEERAKNIKTLDRLANILKKYNSYRIAVEGHANITEFANPARAKAEQDNELLPLSKKRAEAVRQALIERGIAGNRLDTLGVGGARPLVDFADAANRWKNRRVEFILRK